MKKTILVVFAILLVEYSVFGQYNKLIIPDTLSGTEFILVAKDTFRQMLPGQQTITAAYEGSTPQSNVRPSFLSPTMFWKKGTTVNLKVLNNLQEETTVHWHGFHLPAIMDGGPHQIIAPGETWSPFFEVKNNAATYWYHPHLHEMTEEQVTQGLVELIIVRDEIESSLPLPRTYGVDDIPLVLTDRRFDSDNQFVMSHYGDTATVNGVVSPEYSLPSQVVRFRLLNGATERSYNIGFSDNRSFSIIASDAGLLDKPVAVTRYVLSAGERVEILVNFSGLSGQSLDLVAYNNALDRDLPGNEPANIAVVPDFIRNKLGSRRFNLLHLNIVSQNAQAITSIPENLTPNSYLKERDGVAGRRIVFSDLADSELGEAGCGSRTGCSWFNDQFFDINRIDYKVKSGDTEIWELVNNSALAHPFHIHDVSFNILSRSNRPLQEYEKGWKDVVLVNANATVRFIAKFDDYTDPGHPYMYHCHINFHEDAGMMGQFVVDNTSDADVITGIDDPYAELSDRITVYPNPTNGNLFIKAASGIMLSNVEIINSVAVPVMNVDFKNLNAGIDVYSLTEGIYFLKIRTSDGKLLFKKFIKSSAQK